VRWESEPSGRIVHTRRLTEDDRDALKVDIQEITDKYEAKVSGLTQAKETEVLEQ
jgi:ribosome recycling factor